MDIAQKVLFGDFPRAVGTNQPSGQLRQWVVHSEGEFDVFFDTVNGYKNVYASLSWRPIGGELKLDKVSIDFDTPQKERKEEWPVFGGDEPPEDEAIARMRNEEYIADEVLAPVISDAQSMIERSQEYDIPTLAVFSGFGIHVHQFYKEKDNPDKQIDTTGKKYVKELNLKTADMSPIGDVKRVMRVPNAERVHLQMNEKGFIESTRGCGIYTIPLLPDELMDITASELLEMSTSPRNFNRSDLEYLHPENRPEMKMFDDYLSTGKVGEVEQKDMRKLDDSAKNDDFLNYLLKEYLRMPCMYERIKQPEPDHAVRRNCAVLLFNSGFGPGEVIDLFSRLGWSDWDRSVTSTQVHNIYDNGYADMSCRTLRKEGFCTRADDPYDCPAFGWSGGMAEWK